MTKLSLLFLSLCTLAAAEPAADLDKRLADLEKAAKSAQSAGDNAWMLTSAALVLMMTGPGLALFYGGLVRTKNVLSTMMHSFVLMAVVSVLWAVVGYSIAFGEGNSFFGGLQYLFLHGVGADPNARLRAHHSARHLHDLSVDVRHHHARADLRSVCGAHEVFRHAAVQRPVDAVCLFSDGAHGLGQERISRRYLGPGLHLRFRRRDCCPHHLRRFGAGVRIVSRKAEGLWRRSHAPAQPGAEHRRRVPAVGWMVRIQRRQRTSGVVARDQCLRRHPLRHRRGRARVDVCRMDQERQTQHARRHFREQ